MAGFVRGEAACEFQNIDVEEEEGKLKLRRLENEVKLGAEEEERPSQTHLIYGCSPLLSSGNPGFAYSVVTLLKCVLESAEHQHLHAHDLFQIRKESFRRQSIVSEGCEKVHAYATEKTLGEMTLDFKTLTFPLACHLCSFCLSG